MDKTLVRPSSTLVQPNSFPTFNTPVPADNHGVRSIRNTIVICASVVTTAYLCTLATISHGTDRSEQVAFLAAFVVLMATLPPLHFGSLKINGAAKQLLVVAWRLAILIPALAIATRMTEGERKCFLFALMACYFISLPLESWLLIRDVRRQQDSSS